MLWTAIVLITLWMLGMVSGYPMGSSIHILPFMAIIAMLIQMEDDCGNEATGLQRKMYMKRQSVRRPGNISPRLALLSGEKASREE
jgi:hypothetical protein